MPRQVELVRRSSAAIAIARSWIARPVESKTVISSSRAAALGLAREHGAELGHVRRARARRPRPRRRARRRGSPAPSRRRRRGRARAPRPRSRPCRGRRRPSGSTCWPARSEPSASRISRPGVTVTTTSAASASSSARGDADAELGRDRPTRAPASTSQSATSRPRAANVRAAAAAVHARADHRARAPRAPERLGREHRGGARPQRRDGAGVEHGLEQARLGVREQRRARVTVGSPRAGLPGKDVTHFSSAWPPPSAGIARKSPAG